MRKLWANEKWRTTLPQGRVAKLPAKTKWMENKKKNKVWFGMKESVEGSTLRSLWYLTPSGAILRLTRLCLKSAETYAWPSTNTTLP